MTAANDFTRTASKAMQLPIPAAIARLILASTDGAHNGLRAANYEARTTGTGHDVHLTHPEAGAERRIEHASDNRRATDDLRTISKASERFVDAIAALNAECLDASPPETWDDAVKDADMLATQDLIQSALDVGRNVTGWVKQAQRAVEDIRFVHHCYQPKPATRWVQIREDGLNADEICDTCASLTPPVYVAVRNKERLACRHCNDLWLKAGERPPKDVKQAYHHASQLEYRKALSRWLAGLGVRACG